MYIYILEIDTYASHLLSYVQSFKNKTHLSPPQAAEAYFFSFSIYPAVQFFALKTEVGFSEGAIDGYRIYLTQSVKLTDEIKMSNLY